MVLAVGGSLVMVFSSSAQLLRLSVVALLWVAVTCSIAVTKYRKDAAASAARNDELKRVYALELEREVSARREHELVVERQFRAQLSAQLDAQPRERPTDDLAGLRDEVKALRESLSALFSGDMVVERMALRAESTRIRSVTDGATMSSALSKELTFSDLDRFVDAYAEEEQAQPPWIEAESFAMPESEPVPENVPVPESVPAAGSRPVPGTYVEPEPSSERVEYFPRVAPYEPREPVLGPARSIPVTTPTEAAEHNEHAHEEDDGPRRTVSELLAAYGGEPLHSGRRRRR